MGEKEIFDPATVGVFLTSHPRQQMFWDEALPSWKDSPFHVILCYDDVNDNKIKDIVKERYPWIKAILCTGRRSGHVRGELSQMQIAAKYFSDLKYRYILKEAADYKIDPSKIYILWEAVEKKVNQGADGLYGSQLLHIGTTLIFSLTDIFYAMMKPFDFNAKCGAAELYFNKQRYNLNIIRAGFDGGKPKLEELLSIHHVQGQYAYDNKTSIQATWDIGEIWK